MWALNMPFSTTVLSSHGYPKTKECLSWMDSIVPLGDSRTETMTKFPCSTDQLTHLSTLPAIHPCRHLKGRTMEESPLSVDSYIRHTSHTSPISSDHCLLGVILSTKKIEINMAWSEVLLERTGTVLRECKAQKKAWSTKKLLWQSEKGDVVRSQQC